MPLLKCTKWSVQLVYWPMHHRAMRPTGTLCLRSIRPLSETARKDFKSATHPRTDPRNCKIYTLAATRVDFCEIYFRGSNRRASIPVSWLHLTDITTRKLSNCKDVDKKYIHRVSNWIHSRQHKHMKKNILRHAHVYLRKRGKQAI